MAFVVSRFPCYDEPFFVRDIAALGEAGLRVLILSIKPCRDPIVHAAAEAMLPLRVRFPLFLGWQVWWSLGAMVLTRLPRFLSALAELLRHSWPSPGFLAKGLLLVPQACAYARVVEKRRIGHVHALWASLPATVALLIHRLTGIRWSFSGHAFDVYTDTTGLCHKMEQAAFVVTSAAATRRHLLGLRPAIAPERIHVIHHGLDTRHEYVPAETEPVEPPLRIVSVGSLLPCKGFDRLLEAIRLLRQRRVPVRLTIVGGGPLDRALRRMARALDVASVVTFAGYQTQEGMPARYQAAHCFALAAVPEIHWGIPNVLAEAMACGLPVATTSLPAVPELVGNGVSGFLVPEPSPELMARCLERLAGNPSLRRAMGAAARRRAQELFDAQRNAAGWKKLFVGQESGGAACPLGIELPVAQAIPGGSR